MPYATSSCITTASGTDCSYTQVAAYETYDPGIVMGLAFIVLIMAATFTRNVFYR